MPWSSDQKNRLGIEKGILEKYFSAGAIQWVSPHHGTKVEVKMATNSGNMYTIRIYLPDDFPNSCPSAVITSPPRLRQKNGQPLPENSSSFHTLGNVDGCTSICHFFPLHWNQQNTLYQVFMKGRLWLEAYEGHLSTGKSLDVYLPEQVGPLTALFDAILLDVLTRR